mmetsp:Transcript_7811/g.9091  ORF Transcript_7811/g.9091 Transcript_7811/m.9091 type:complete len:92 (+) Transcript_7811:2040-2315(+)
MDEAQEAVEKQKKREKLMIKDYKAIIACVLPLSGSNDAPSYYSTIPKIKERLELLPLHWSTCFKTDLSDGDTSANNDTPEVVDKIILNSTV